MEILIGIIAIAFISYFWYSHLVFWKTFKSEAPEEYKANSDLSLIKYTKGMQWVDYALQKKYTRLNNSKISDAGEALIRAYSFYQSFTGLALLAISIGGLVWAFMKIT